MPDYVLAMRKAAAIITDEGGITCHTLIISRELQKQLHCRHKDCNKIIKGWLYSAGKRHQQR